MSIPRMSIQRIPGASRGRCKASIANGFVYAVATAPDTSADVAGQTRQTLTELDAVLAEAGTDKTRIVSATIYLADILFKKEMDAVWCDWIGAEANWPQRACVGAALEGDTTVEIVLVVLA